MAGGDLQVKELMFSFSEKFHTYSHNHELFETLMANRIVVSNICKYVRLLNDLPSWCLGLQKFMIYEL